LGRWVAAIAIIEMAWKGGVSGGTGQDRPYVNPADGRFDRRADGHFPRQRDIGPGQDAGRYSDMRLMRRSGRKIVIRLSALPMPAGKAEAK